LPKYLTDAEWESIRQRFVYGDVISYKDLAELSGVARITLEHKASPRSAPDGKGWRKQRQEAKKELQLDERARLLRDQAALESNRSLDFEERYELTTDRVNDLLDMLLDTFVPPPDASEIQLVQCKAQLDMLTPNQKASLISKCVERMAGVAKTRQLLSGGSTERLLIDLKNTPDLTLPPEIESQIEEVLAAAMTARSSSDV